MARSSGPMCRRLATTWPGARQRRPAVSTPAPRSTPRCFSTAAPVSPTALSHGRVLLRFACASGSRRRCCASCAPVTREQRNDESGSFGERSRSVARGADQEGGLSSRPEAIRDILRRLRCCHFAPSSRPCIVRLHHERDRDHQIQSLRPDLWRESGRSGHVRSDTGRCEARMAKQTSRHRDDSRHLRDGSHCDRVGARSGRSVGNGLRVGRAR